jgi:Tfp pilus assembly protein PilF
VPNIAETLQQAILLQRQGDPAQAETLYRMILRSDPRFTPAIANLGAALMEQQRYAEALDHFEQAPPAAFSVQALPS